MQSASLNTNNSSFQKFLLDEWRLRIGQLMVNNELEAAAQLKELTQSVLKFGINILAADETQLQCCIEKCQPRIRIGGKIPWWHDEKLLAILYQDKPHIDKLCIPELTNEEDPRDEDYLTANEEDQESSTTNGESSHCQNLFGSDSEGELVASTPAEQNEPKKRRRTKKKSASNPSITSPFGENEQGSSRLIPPQVLPKSGFKPMRTFIAQPKLPPIATPSDSFASNDSEWIEAKHKKSSSSVHPHQRIVLICGKWPTFETTSQVQLLRFAEKFPQQVQEELIMRKRLHSEVTSVSIAPNTQWAFGQKTRKSGDELQRLCRFINETCPDATVTIAGFYDKQNLGLKVFNDRINEICKQFRHTVFIRFEDFLEPCELQIVVRQRDRMETLSRDSISIMLKRLCEC